MDPSVSKRYLCHGLTLVEMLVALSLMALMAALSWRTLDGLWKTEAVTREHADAQQSLRVAVAQWTTDLDQMQSTSLVPDVWFDGISMRVVRRLPPQEEGVPPGLIVVAWALHADRSASKRGTVWVRWESEPIQDLASLGLAWQAAEVWARNTTSELAQRAQAIVPITDWRLLYHRGGAWSNPLSAADVNRQSGARPDGIRLLLELPSASPLGGEVVVDWVQPALTRRKGS